MPLELSPETERQVMERAQAAGTTVDEYIARLLKATVPVALNDPADRVRALLAQWQQQDHTPTAAPAPNDGTLTPSEALFREWDEEDAKLTDEERRTAEEFWRDFQEGINEERRASGMRPIF